MGTALIQVYGAHGKMAYAIVPIAICMNIYFALSFSHLGFQGVCHSAMDMFEYYCGPYLGKAFKALTIVFLFLSPLCMVSGFGASLNQHYGIAPWIGAVIMAVLCLITVLMGLKRLVNIVGAVGPIIIILCLLVGGYSIITNIDGLAAGLQASLEIPIVKYNDSWFISGLLEAAWAPLILGPFMIACCSTVKTEKEARTGSILGLLGVALATTTIITCYFCQYAEVSQNPIPTLYIVNSISPSLASVFIIIVFLGIYSSAVPSQFNFCDTFMPKSTSNASEGQKKNSAASIQDVWLMITGSCAKGTC